MITCLSFSWDPFTFLYNVVAGIIRSLGDSKTPFYFLVLSAVMNIFLDMLFIIVFKLGTAGAGWATILSQAISGILCFIYMKKKYDVLKTNVQERKLDMHYIKTLFTMAVPMGLQFSITAIGSIMLQSAVNTLGAVYVSSFATAAKVKQLAMCPYGRIRDSKCDLRKSEPWCRKLKTNPGRTEIRNYNFGSVQYRNRNRADFCRFQDSVAVRI